MLEIKLVVTHELSDNLMGLFQRVLDMEQGTPAPQVSTVHEQTPEDAAVDPEAPPADPFEDTAPVEVPGPADPPGLEPDDMDREELMKELVERGVEVKPRTQTNTLRKMLADARNPAETSTEPVDPPSTPSTDDDFLDAPPPVDIEVVRAALVDYSNRNSKDMARDLLKNTGGVAKISELKPDKFQAMLDACKG